MDNDFSVLARRVTGVSRATTVGGYNPNHNLLSENQSNLETDLTGWVGAGTNCTATRSTTQAASGSASLRLSSTAGGDMSTTTDTGLSGVPVEPGQLYVATARARTAVSARSVSAGISWYDAAGAFISEDIDATAADATNWNTSVEASAVAPTLAAFAAVKVIVAATGGASELHYFDEIGLTIGNPEFGWVVGDTPAYDNERMVTVFALDDTGQPVNSGVRTDIDTYLQGLREANFLINEADPLYTALDVAYAVTVDPSFDADEVGTAVTDAITVFLDPASWGLPAEGTGQSLEWRNINTLRYLDLATLINNVDGVDTIDSLTLCLAGGTPASIDVKLQGAAGLPSANSITGTAS